SAGGWQRFTPDGVVEFAVDGEPVGEPAALTDATAVGMAEATLTVSLEPGEYQVEARYLGERRVLASPSEASTLVVDAQDVPGAEEQQGPEAESGSGRPAAPAWARPARGAPGGLGAGARAALLCAVGAFPRGLGRGRN